MIQFIKQANQWGAERRPFFFLIDFEQQKPLIFSLDEMEKKGVSISFPDLPSHISTSSKTFEFQTTPLDFARYQTAFEQVKQIGRGVV